MRRANSSPILGFGGCPVIDLQRLAEPFLVERDDFNPSLDRVQLEPLPQCLRPLARAWWDLVAAWKAR
jgi:hypothetical protein